MKINLLLTFDYELPLGNCSSYNKGIFEPTKKLINKANKLKVPIVLFADICSAIKFKKWDYSYYEKFKSDIQLSLETGHDVQLHIHPHWMDSEYKDGVIKPSKRFGLSDFKNHKTITIEKIIQEAYTELHNMCKEFMSEYKCIAYRAGGYNVEPESNIILSTLYKLGIKYESSVIKEMYQNSSFNKIDYRNAPKLNSWKVPITGPLISTAKGKEPFITELPISSMPNSIYNIVKRRIRKTQNRKNIKSRKYYNSGEGYIAISKKINLISKIRRTLNPISLTFDRDYMETSDLEKIVNYIIKKNKNKKEIFITLISHPKSMGKYHINLMEKFVCNMKNKYSNNLEFTTYSKINNKNMIK